MNEFQEGVFFGMKAADYHLIPALSSSGIKWLSVSAEDFWARTPWLNPLAESVSTSALSAGKAYHARIVEGPVAFASRFCAQLDKADYPDALVTADDMRNALREAGLKTGGNKDELTDRLLEHDPGAQIWARMQESYHIANAGKVMLAQGLIDDIEIAAAMIEKHPVIGKCFRGGHPEVVICWIDPETGVPLKAMLDYLKVGAIIDLKSFSNPQERSIERAIYAAVEYRKYYVQAAHYMDAASQIADLAHRGLIFTANGEFNGESQWIAKVGSNPKEFVFVFQQTGIAKVTRCVRLPDTMVMGIGNAICRAGIEKFKAYRELYGDSQWLEIGAVADLDDAGFTAFIGR